MKEKLKAFHEKLKALIVEGETILTELETTDGEGSFRHEKFSEGIRSLDEAEEAIHLVYHHED